MLTLLYFAVGALAACSTYSTTTGQTSCLAETESYCKSVCDAYASKAGCNGRSGCAWANVTIGGMTTSSCATQPSQNCGSISNATTCGGNPMCTWSVLPCDYRFQCRGTSVFFPNSTCRLYSTSSSCNVQSTCTWKATCELSTQCGRYHGQSNCTATTGCFWTTATRTEKGVTGTTGSCSSCFTESNNTENAYLSTKALSGQTCTMTVGSSSTKVKIGVVAGSSSGCSGGLVYNPMPVMATCVSHAAGLSASLALLLGLTFLA